MPAIESAKLLYQRVLPYFIMCIFAAQICVAMALQRKASGSRAVLTEWTAALDRLASSTS